MTVLDPDDGAQRKVVMDATFRAYQGGLTDAEEAHEILGALGEYFETANAAARPVDEPDRCRLFDGVTGRTCRLRAGHGGYHHLEDPADGAR